MKKIVVGISGASGVRLGLKFAEKLPKEYQVFIIATKNAKIVAQKEENFTILDNEEISAISASGSSKIDMMAIIPCSMNSLAKISYGIADDLLSRTAAVMIKEKRKLLIAPRELPYSAIALENMHKLSLLNVIIAPPNIAYYANIESLEDMENFLIGKWFDMLEIENNLYKRWGEE
jgi:4-hydroxy-3-polyprenylbenzoate decarboxylase